MFKKICSKNYLIEGYHNLEIAFDLDRIFEGNVKVLSKLY